MRSSKNWFERAFLSYVIGIIFAILTTQSLGADISFRQVRGAPTEDTLPQIKVTMEAEYGTEDLLRLSFNSPVEGGFDERRSVYSDIGVIIGGLRLVESSRWGATFKLSLEKGVSTIGAWFIVHPQGGPSRLRYRGSEELWLAYTARTGFRNLAIDGTEPPFSAQVPINTTSSLTMPEASAIRDIIRRAKRSWHSESYNIDTLLITTYTPPPSSQRHCQSGSDLLLELTGVISPDSSFAVEELLNRFPACKDENSVSRSQPIVSLKSGGGFLNDGYKLGSSLRKHKAVTLIPNESYCASSCAVAYLGGATRIVEDAGKIMFHAPYFSGKNEYGKREIDCDVGDDALTELKSYYISMTDKETGERLFERTMWHCSADDGWVITGGAAAELFGIATVRKTPEPAYVPQTSEITGIDLAMLGMKLMDTGTFGGVWVVEVIPNSPADDAGLKSGDIVTRFARRSITKIDDLNEAKIDLYSSAAIPVLIIRAGRPQFLAIRLPN